MRLLLSFAAALLVAAANAQQDFEYWPNADYDPSIPTVESILGHAPGERITWHKDALRYFRALESSQPDRVSVHRYASSWEGRELVYVVITSAENMRRIDEIKRDMQSLRNAADTSRSEADRIIRSGPAITWLAYGIHGDEISSTDAAMLTAYHLLAARGDSRVDNILRKSVIILDPMLNPDGRDRFIHGFEMAEGLSPDPDRLSAEHDQPWPSGRGNHYLFDLNRDWVSNGGVLIALGSANRYLADANIDLLSIRRENAVGEEEDDAEDDSSDSGRNSDEDLEATVEGRNLESLSDYEKAIAPQSPLPDSLSGVLLRADVTSEHWLGAGVASSLNVLARGTDIYTPIRLDSGVNVARFSSPDNLLASGYMWEENRQQLAFKPFAVVQPSGRGFVIAFTQDPTIRAYLDGLNVIFANAIFRGAAHARPMH